MPIPGIIVKSARLCWKWQWDQLMNALAPSDQAGNYLRPKSEHQLTESPSIQDIFSRSKEILPILIIGKSCPWAQRTWLTYLLKELEDNLNLIIVNPSPSKGKWAFNKTYLGCQYLEDLYIKCDSNLNHRATVPALIDCYYMNKNKPKLLCNESSQIIEILNKWPSNKSSIDLAPKELTSKINFWSELLQTTVNDGVYRCGFARNQYSYDLASAELFNSLNQLEQNLSLNGPWLCGQELTLADIRLFPTLIRWEHVYMPLFGCSEKPLWAYPSIWEWRKRFFNLPKVAQTCDAKAWRSDYFGNLFPLRPSGIVPAGEDLRNIVNAQVPKIKKQKESP